MGILLKSNTWKKIEKLLFDYYNVTATLTSNEDFIIIAGGYDMGTAPSIVCLH